MIETIAAKKSEAKLVKKVYKSALKYLKQKDVFKTEVCFVTEDEIKSLNLENRKIDKVTDVLSFPYLNISKLPVSKADFIYSDSDGRGRILLGSIAICRSRAEQQAYEYGHSVEREIAFLAVHGVLHLLGYDHEEGKAQESEMFSIQEKVLDGCKIYR